LSNYDNGNLQKINLFDARKELFANARANKTIEQVFNAYNEEVKKRESVEEELRICKMQLANLERLVYPNVRKVSPSPLWRFSAREKKL
jgi:hypothetical protein